MSTDRNQYGRRTWDVEAYAQKRAKKGVAGGDDNGNNDDSGWLVCVRKGCRRRFKDSKSLSMHSKQCTERGGEVDSEREVEIEISEVIKHIREREGKD